MDIGYALLDPRVRYDRRLTLGAPKRKPRPATRRPRAAASGGRDAAPLACTIACSSCGLCLFGIIVLAAALAPLIAPEDPNKLAMRFKFLPPSAEHPFGTDNFGRSQWSRVVLGRAALDGHRAFGGGAQRRVRHADRRAGRLFPPLDNALMRVNDALMAFPAILLAIGITAVLGPSTIDVIIALAIAYIPRTARIVRSSVIVLREMEYVQAAVAAGAGHWRILRRHILPNAMAPLIVQLSFLFAYAVLSEATLSFLGLGAVPPTPTWGNIMAEGANT